MRPAAELRRSAALPGPWVDAMIELIPSERDDVAFLRLARRIVNGAVAAIRGREVYLVQVDNWFDHKWLGYWSRGRKDRWELRVPPFNPSRVLSEKHLTWDESLPGWAPAAMRRPLHVRQPGRPWNARPLDRISGSAAFIWYSGNTITNTAASLMLYLSGAEDYAWYASFKKEERWEHAGERRIARRELVSFEKDGRRMEAVRILDRNESS